MRKIEHHARNYSIPVSHGTGSINRFYTLVLASLSYVFLILCLLVIHIGSHAQSKQELVFTINGSLDNKSEVFTFQDRSGYLMQNQSDGLYRLRIADIESIVTKSNQESAMVEVKCRDTGCFSISKGDSSSYTMNSFAYLFSGIDRANRFAQSLHKLCGYFQGDPNPVQLQMIKGEKTISEPPIAPKTTEAPVQQKDAIDEAMEEDEKEEKLTAKKEKTAREDEEEKNDDEGVSEKRGSRKVVTKEEDDEEPKAKAPGRRVMTEDVGLAGETADHEVKKESLLCKQLLQVVQSGMTSDFKSIEGAETNPKTHINDSKIKLKGAKRNYLSWHKNQRAFISEIKTTRVLEDIQFDYDDLQTEIENGLGPDWDSEDMSNDEEYSNFSGEVRDTEYKSSQPGMPTIRIIMLSDGEDKFTLFVRVKKG